MKRKGILVRSSKVKTRRDSLASTEPGHGEAEEAEHAENVAVDPPLYMSGSGSEGEGDWLAATPPGISSMPDIDKEGGGDRTPPPLDGSDSNSGSECSAFDSSDISSGSTEDRPARAPASPAGSAADTEDAWIAMQLQQLKDLPFDVDASPVAFDVETL